MFSKFAVIETEFLAKIESKLFEIAEVEIFSLLKLISIERTYAKLPFFLSNFDVVNTEQSFHCSIFLNSSSRTNSHSWSTII